MALNVFMSNDPENLVLKLRERSDIGEKNVFTKENIVVQTEGLSRWLSVQMALRSEVFANFHFTTPNSLIFELFSLAKINLPDIYATNNLKWLIYKIFNDDGFKTEFPEIANYYRDDKIKQLQLATRLSDLFDQYSFFRPDIILNWNNDIENEIKRKYKYHEQWQKWIWKKLKELVSDQVSDRVEMFYKFLNSLKDDDNLKARINRKYPKLTVFGFSSISQLHISVLDEMSKYTSDIDFFLFNPAPEVYWLHDIPEKTKLKIERYYRNQLSGLNLESGNRLLMDLGKTARYFFLMIFNNEEFLNNLDNESLVSVPGRDSLLQWIRNDIYYNIPDIERKPIPEEIINDGSVVVTSHYSIGREVEALYNYLLDIFKDPTVKPRNIIVQTVNIDKYVPYIKSVFENAKYKIPYTIADRSYHGFDNPIGILEKMLSLREDEFTSEQIFQFFDFKPVKDKFDVQDTEMIRIIIENANIRTGINGAREDESYIVSWKNGLERIILGFAINSDELIDVPGSEYKNLPLGFIENDFAEEGLKLVGFVNLLIENINQRKINRSLNGWKEFIQKMINDFFVFEQNDQLNYINEKLSFPDLIDEFSGNDISYEIFVSAFLESIYQDTRKGSFYSGNVTFCSMVPMRSIPFRIVAVLGLDFNSFPRKNTEILFDLMNAEHRPGDRNNKESDKFLFLETILSAREKLYLSYIGQDSKTNNEKPASPVIESLIDYIFYFESDQSKKKKFIIKHPLHNFSSRYFDPEFPQLYTYSDVKSQATGDIFMEIELPVDEDENKIREINIRDLLSFYKNSIEWYYRKSLKINYRENEILIPETELFEMDHLQEYNLIFKLLELNDESDLEEFILKEKISGNLPLKSAGTITVKKAIAETAELKKEFIDLTNSKKPETIDFELEIIEGVFLSGTVENIYDNKNVIVSPSKNLAKKIIQLQMQRLILSVSKPEIKQFILLSLRDEKVEKMTLNSCEIEEAQKKLRFLVDIFMKYDKEILVFTADAAYEMYKATGNSRIKKTPEEKFVESLTKKSEYDNYLRKYLEFNEDDTIISLLEQQDYPVSELNEIFFN